MSDLYKQGAGGYPYGAPNQPQNPQPKRKPIRAIISMILGINGAACALIGVIYLFLIRMIQFALDLSGHYFSNYYSMRTMIMTYDFAVISLAVHSLIIGVISIIQGNIYLRNHNVQNSKFVTAGRITSIIGMGVGLIIFFVACTALVRLIIAR